MLSPHLLSVSSAVDTIFRAMSDCQALHPDEEEEYSDEEAEFGDEGMCACVAAVCSSVAVACALLQKHGRVEG